MKAQQLRTIILQLADPVALQTALDLLRTGGSLTAVQSGTVAYGPLEDGVSGPLTNGVELGPPPVVFFDGVFFTFFLYYVSG